MKTDQERFEAWIKSLDPRQVVVDENGACIPLSQQAWHTALASLPTAWHDWSKEKPVVENEFRATMAVLEWTSDYKQTCYFLGKIDYILNDAQWVGTTRLAWHYILPSPFSVKPKSKAEIAWEDYHTQIPELVAPMSKSTFIYIYELGQKAGEK